MQTSHDPPSLSCACSCVLNNNECYPLISLFPILEKRCRGLVSVPRCVSLPEVGSGLARSGSGCPGLEDELPAPRPAHQVLLPGGQEEHAEEERFVITLKSNTDNRHEL